MEKDIITWTFIIVFIITAIITLTGIIKNFKWIEIEDKYLKVLASALILEVIGVIIMYGASIFNEMSLESAHKKEVENYELLLNKSKKELNELNIKLAEARKETKRKSIEISQLKKEMKELSYTLSKIQKAEEKDNAYTFEDAHKEFRREPVYFVANTNKIDSKSIILLDLAVEKLGKYKNISIKLHPITPRNHDFSLITKRQEAIRAYLVEKGFTPQNIVNITNSRYGNGSDEIYNEENDLIEEGVYLELELKYT